MASDESILDLATAPLCHESDLGKAIPDSPHATSVCLPRWKHVVGYEENDPEVLGTFEAGYPRFFLHPITRLLFSQVTEEFARSGERSLVFPDLGAGWRCADFVKMRTGLAARIEPTGFGPLTAVSVPEEGIDSALLYWRYSGEIVSSRQAEAAIESRAVGAEESERASRARQLIRERIATLQNQPAKNVFLFPSGMAAIFAVHRALGEIFPEGRKTAQVEFPYVDSLCVQREFGPGAIDLSIAPSGGVAEIESLLAAGEKLAGVYSELPSNPLLRTADLAGLSKLCSENEIPLLVDDTVGTAINVEALRFADVVTTSLTKLFSGIGDVMAGAVLIKDESPFRDAFLNALSHVSEDSLYGEDAIALEGNSRDFAERVAGINRGAEEVFEFLGSHSAIEHVWYPKTETRNFYDDALREGGGFSGLISLSLKDGEKRAPEFYDRLEFSKGPSLGTNFSLACPYTLLAHYQELEWAAKRGVPEHLIRLWIGLEDPADLIARLEGALV